MLQIDRVSDRASTPRPHRPRLATAAAAFAVVLVLASGFLARPAEAQPVEASAPLRSIERLEVQRYLGIWYQVAWYPNRFQKQCVSDTAARYSLREDGRLAVLNECRNAQGQLDTANGVARPVGRLAGGTLEPAQLEVSFLPAFLRWTGIGWGRYWVIDLPEDYRYAVISEPTREYLWILSRTPQLAPGDRDRIRQRVQALGFDLDRWVDHPQSAPAPR